MTTNFNIKRLKTTSILVVQISILSTVLACTEEPVIDQESGSAPLSLTVKNDSRIAMNDTTFPISELGIYLKKAQWQSSPDQTVLIKADPSVRMQTIKKIERALAMGSIQKILYLFQGDTIEMNLVSTPMNSINLTVNSNGKLTYAEKEVSNEWLTTNLKDLVTNKKDPYVELTNESGTSYHAFSKQKDRIENILAEIDSTVELKEGQQDFYERMK